jgi:N-methylhydantoinase A
VNEMPVKIGVDVGGTFTKAVACESFSGEVVASASVPTSHAAASGVAEGVVRAVGDLQLQLSATGAPPAALVAHSSTQAVNALLEGDTAVVGVLGIGRHPDVRRARRRTKVGDILLAPGRRLRTVHSFLDATRGVERAQLVEATRGLLDRGAQALCVSEAFGVEDPRAEWAGLEAASDLGVAACAGHELSGLYGLELRTLTGAINASILPTALRTARLVEEAVRQIGDIPLLVMRGDGGAAALSSMRRHPIQTAFSGPAASVAGALRHLRVRDAIVIEVGGTSTNVSAIKGGRPVLSYVRVLEHVTAVRSLDVRVAGVAGGSLIRARRRRIGWRVEDIGPRSAHIAGMRYCSFATERELNGARVEFFSPRAGDPDDYLILVTPGGARFAPTTTCAANALAAVAADTYARGNRDAAQLAFQIAARDLRVEWRALAKQVLDRAVEKIAACVVDTMRENKLERPDIVGLGGGAGALVPRLSDVLGLHAEIPQHAEIISSIGDALSLVRVEVERNLAGASARELAAAHEDAEAAAIRAGAAPGSVQVESAAMPERSALRIVAYGSGALGNGDAPDVALPDHVLGDVARAELEGEVRLVAAVDRYRVFVRADDDRCCAVIDESGGIAHTGTGELITGTGYEVASMLEARIPALVRRYGPIEVAPAIRIVRGARLIDLTLLSAPDRALEAAAGESAAGGDDLVVALISRG